MDTKLLDYIDRFKKIREEKEQARHQRRAAKYRAVNVADLTTLFHSVGKVQLPIPTLLSDHLIRNYFGNYNSIDLTDPKHLAAIVCFYENGNKPAFGSMNREQLDAEIAKTMAGISGAMQTEYYIECITQINLSMQKKNLQQPQQMLEQMLRTLADQPVGAQS